MKINPGNARGLLVPQGDRPFSFVVYSSEIRDFGVLVGDNKIAIDNLIAITPNDESSILFAVTRQSRHRLELARIRQISFLGLIP